MLLKVDTGEIAHVAEGPFTAFVWSPDGSHMVFGKDEQHHEIWMVETKDLQRLWVAAIPRPRERARLRALPPAVHAARNRDTRGASPSPARSCPTISVRTTRNTTPRPGRARATRRRKCSGLPPRAALHCAAHD